MPTPAEIARRDELLELFMSEEIDVMEAMELRRVLRSIVEDPAADKNDRLLASFVTRLMDIRELDGVTNVYRIHRDKLG